VIKRESGVSPEQSRCCKVSIEGVEQYSEPLFKNKWEGRSILKQVRRPAKITSFKAFEE